MIIKKSFNSLRKLSKNTQTAQEVAVSKSTLFDVIRVSIFLKDSQIATSTTIQWLDICRSNPIVFFPFVSHSFPCVNFTYTSCISWKCWISPFSSILFTLSSNLFNFLMLNSIFNVIVISSACHIYFRIWLMLLFRINSLLTFLSVTHSNKGGRSCNVGWINHLRLYRRSRSYNVGRINHLRLYRSIRNCNVGRINHLRLCRSNRCTRNDRNILLSSFWINISFLL